MSNIRETLDKDSLKNTRQIELNNGNISIVLEQKSQINELSANSNRESNTFFELQEKELNQNDDELIEVNDEDKELLEIKKRSTN